MNTYSYKAKDSETGAILRATVQAENEKTAAKLIAAQGYSPIDISLKSDGHGLNFFKGRVKSADKVIFSRQLSTLLNAGLPLSKALSTVEGQTKSKSLKAIIGDLRASIETGSKLSVAMSKYPNVFNEVYVSLLAAGEASGGLDKSLERLADQQERDAEIISKIRGALTYPAIVISIIALVVVFMLRSVLPQVEALYKDLKKPLPPLTQLLLEAAAFVGRYQFVFIILVGVAIFSLARYLRTDQGRYVVDSIKPRLPAIGFLYRKLYMARFCRTAFMLVSSGVSLIESLSITGSATGNKVVEASVRAAIEKVKGGIPLSKALRGDPQFDDLVPEMIQTGEESGSLDLMLDKSAGYYEKQLDNAIKTISTIIEPILMVILSVVVLVLIAAVLLPIYQLVGNTNLR